MIYNKYVDTPKFKNNRERDMYYDIRDMYIKMILKYSKMVGKTSNFGITITEEWLDVLRTRYNSIKPKLLMEK